MKKFTSYILACLLALMSFAAVAGDSNAYYNPDRTGDGLTVYRNGDTVFFVLFTYDDYQGCWDVVLPDDTPLDEGNCHENRWFVNNADVMLNEDNVTGFLYMSLGNNYPWGVISPNDPFTSRLNDTFIVGLYSMTRHDDGWKVIVTRFGDALDAEDSLFGRVMQFDAVIFPGTD